MGRAILDIAREAAERYATAPKPAALFTGNDRIARILRIAASDVTRDILRKSRFTGLSEFHSQWVFEAKPGISSYSLPPDYLRMIPDSEQRNGWPLGLIGPASPQTWANWVAGAITTTAPMGWRIKNNVLFLHPMPEAKELLVIEYISRYPVVADITPADFDNTVIPAQVALPLVPRDGYLDPTYRDLRQAQWDEDGGTTPQDPNDGYEIGLWGNPFYDELSRIAPTESTVLAQVRKDAYSDDMDRPAFEDDHILSLGMTFHLRRALGMPYDEVAAEYEEETMVKLGEDAGGSRNFRLGGEGSGTDCWPLGNGQWLVT